MKYYKQMQASSVIIINAHFHSGQSVYAIVHVGSLKRLHTYYTAIIIACLYMKKYQRKQ